MEVESLPNRMEICKQLNRKLIVRPGSLELIEKGVLEIDSEIKNILRCGDIMFRRVSSDETDNSSTSPSHKILKHQEALDDATARRLSLAAQQQKQQLLQLDEKEKMMNISENDNENAKPEKVVKSTSNPSCSGSKPLITSQISRFKGLVFHNYCPVGSLENQEARLQQQDKLLQMQGSDPQKPRKCLQKQNSTEHTATINWSGQQTQLQVSNNCDSVPSHVQTTQQQQQSPVYKCARCVKLPDRVSSLAELTVAQLKTECRLRGLSRAGNKQALISTLVLFETEILAAENACSHVVRNQQILKQKQHQQPQQAQQAQLPPHLLHPSQPPQHQQHFHDTADSVISAPPLPHRPQLNDRSISLPTEYYDNCSQDPFNSLLAPVTLNFACVGGSFSNLPLTPYSIFFGDTVGGPAQTTPDTNASSAGRTSQPQQHEQQQHNRSSTASSILVSSSSVDSSLSSQAQPRPPIEGSLDPTSPGNSASSSATTSTVNHQHSQPVMHNPLLFYKLPSPLNDQENAFIQTNGLEMIQLVQQELLRNIETQSSCNPSGGSNDERGHAHSGNLAHQREVLLNFLNQLIQKTPAFFSCSQLLADQTRISEWLLRHQQQYKCSSIDLLPSTSTLGSGGPSNCYHSFLSYLNQTPSPADFHQQHQPGPWKQSYPAVPVELQHQQEEMVVCSGDNDLLNLINEVVNEETQLHESESVQSKPDKNLAAIQTQILDKPLNSPMMVESEPRSGGDQKRAAWLQKVSPRLYKPSESQQQQQSFSVFNFDQPWGSSHEAGGSSEGGGSINSSITDAQILSPDTERVLFQTIFQHTNSGSSTDHDFFSTTAAAVFSNPEPAMESLQQQ